MTFENLNPELREKALACKSTDELIKLAEEEGVALTDEQLDAIAGGAAWGCDDDTCADYEPYPW